MILMHYPACGCTLEIPGKRDALLEANRSQSGETCPRCRATNPNEITEARLAAARLGSIKTPKKLAAQRANVARINETRQPAACTCGQEPHRYTCRVYKREQVRASKERKAAREAAQEPT